MRADLVCALAALALGCGASTDVVRLGPAPVDASAPRDADSSARCLAPIGRVRLDDGHTCFAVRVGPARALTLASCLRDPGGAAYVPATQMTFRQQATGRDQRVLRVVHLRDADDARPEADLAVLTLSVADADAPAAGLRDGGVLPRTLAVARASGDGAALSSPCRVTQDLGASLTHDCVRTREGDVGALIECSGGAATLYGLDPGGATRSVSTAGLGEIPLRPRSVAVGAAAGSTIYFAFDDDTRRLHVRQRAGAGWGPWRALADARLPMGERAGSLTALMVFGGHPHIAFHEAGSVVQYRWDSATDVSGFGPWFPYRPGQNVGTFVDLASSGGPEDRAHVYALTASGEVLTQYKQDLTPSSDWSPWCSLGAVPAATHIAATRFSAGAPTYQVFAADGATVRTRWAQGPASACGAWAPGGGAWLSMRGDAPTGVSSLAAGTLEDGRPWVALVDAEGRAHLSARAADGSSWSPWVAMTALGALRSLAAGVLGGDGSPPRATLLAITREDAARSTADGELVAIQPAPGEALTDARPRRFYR